MPYISSSSVLWYKNPSSSKYFAPFGQSLTHLQHFIHIPVTSATFSRLIEPRGQFFAQKPQFTHLSRSVFGSVSRSIIRSDRVFAFYLDRSFVDISACYFFGNFFNKFSCYFHIFGIRSALSECFRE